MDVFAQQLLFAVVRQYVWFCCHSTCNIATLSWLHTYLSPQKVVQVVPLSVLAINSPPAFLSVSLGLVSFKLNKENRKCATEIITGYP